MKTLSAARHRRASNSANRLLEALEDRCLLSGSHAAFFHSAGGLGGNTILFSQAPPAVQTGLTNLATLDSLTLPTPDQTVYLRNSKGVESYSIGIAGTGTFTKLTVDLTGTPIVAPTKSTVSFSALSDAAATNELDAIATALGLSAPAPTDTVRITTAADLTATYTFQFAGASGQRGASVTLDANGNPVRSAKLPLSVFSAAIQNGLVSNAPAGADPLTATSLISVQTLNGKTSYSATYTGTAITPVKLTVDKTGALTTLPTTTMVQFSTLPAAAQNELQTLATADGFVGTIDPTTSVRAYDEANGTLIFTIKVPVTKTNPTGTFTFNIELTVDQNGNPTVPPSNGHHHGCGGDHEGDDTGENSGGRQGQSDGEDGPSGSQDNQDQSGEQDSQDQSDSQDSQDPSDSGMAAIVGAFWHKHG